MGEDIDYRLLVQESLRGVVRLVLEEAAEQGLPGNHHFYITFRTQDPGVDIHASLRDTYPDEMTVVLQHQFWDLEVDSEGFSVTLAFAGVQHRLGIPFAAISAFFDPAVRFGLNFQPPENEEDALEGEAEAQDGTAEAMAQDGEPSAEGDDEKGGDNIVSMEAFLKDSGRRG